MKILASFALAGLFLLPAVAQTPEDSHTVIRTDTRLVLVDAVVADKKGNYIHDLTQKDFKVYEDDKEQTVSSFSVETGGVSPDGARKHYLVLFFDNSNASLQQQAYARQAAAKFIDKNTGPNRLIAVVEFGGALKVTQNFTDDAARLKQVVAGVKMASVGSASGSFGNARMDRAFGDFSVRGVLGALRSMAKGLAEVPGRKTLIFLSGGFTVNSETLVEINATVDACNHANVAIYPIDIRGLIAPNMGSLIGPAPGAFASLLYLLMPQLTLPEPALAQTKGGGGTGGGSGGSSGGGAPRGGGPVGGGSGGGGTPSPGGGGHMGPNGPVAGGNNGNGNAGNRGNNTNNGGGGGNTNTNNNPYNNNRNPYDPMNRNNNPRNIIPRLDNSIAGNQEALYMLANGTGGFVILNTNDLLGGLDKIAREQGEYYVLGFSPTKEPQPGACHILKVKVAKSGTTVRARSGYCESKPVDVLSGTPTERSLEARIAGNAPSTVPGASMLAPFFYTSDNTARVNLALDIPAGTIVFAKEKGKLRSVLNVVGIAYLPDGSVGARFSDSVKLSFEDKKQLEEFEKLPFHYEKQFEMAPGKYTLKLAFSSSNEQLGRLEKPLFIDAWKIDQFIISGLALSKRVAPAPNSAAVFDADLIENRVPLIVENLRVIPTGTNRIKKSEKCFVYLEIYEPALAVAGVDAATLPAVAVKMELLDLKSGQVKQDFGQMRLKLPAVTGSPAIPVGLALNGVNLDPGIYQLRVTALDSLGHGLSRSMALQLE